MIGQLVSKYRILEVAGRGAMGIVFKVEDTTTGNLAALKILAEKLVDNPEMLHRFRQEGGAASALDHPNICRVFETGDWKGRPYLAMELLTGQPLDERLRGGVLAPGEVIAIGVGVASGLEAAHSIGVVHRDIKPANLFLTGNGVVKILDFGLAKQKPSSTPIGDAAATVVMRSTGRHLMIGTLAYMSPEQVCCEPLDGRSDLFALGVTLYELATGELPDRAAPNLDPLPAGLRPILRKLLAHDVTLRYQTAAQVRDALRGVILAQRTSY